LTKANKRRNMSRMKVSLDEIGIWSEIKLAILKEYASAYSRILSAQSSPRLHHIYIDGFAGAGKHISKSTGDFVLGSPLNALAVRPPFKEYYLVDLNEARVQGLEKQIGPRADVHLLHGDCNEVLLKQVLPNAKYEDYRRALCVLDPYGLHLDWNVIREAGSMKSVDMFLNFPVADMNRNALWRDPSGVDPADKERMTRFWGDSSWEKAAYSEHPNLFGELISQKEPNNTVAMAFRERLKKVAGFQHVLKPMPMRNSVGAVVYYLFFASQKDTARNIVEQIFAKYQTKGLS
jgi:three-Cys-motif partner protein